MSGPPPSFVDVNVLVAAVAGGTNAFHSRPSPPPVRGTPAAGVVGILNDALEFALFLSPHILSPHILVNTVRVLAGAPPEGFGWSARQGRRYVEVLAAIVAASGGGTIEPKVAVATAPTTRTTGSSDAPSPAGPCSSCPPTTTCCASPPGGAPLS